MSVSSTTERVAARGSADPAVPSLHARIFERAARTPDAVAIRQWDTELSYAELCCRASELAHRLVEMGVGPEDRVVVCTDRRPDMVVAVLGILAAGAAYVPVLPGDPAQRREAVLADSQARLAVIDGRGRAALGSHGLPLVDIPATAPRSVAVPPMDRVVSPDQAAYVLFTSGSTGRPKGVVVTHAAVLNYALDTARRCAADADDVTIGYASIGFDASVIDLYSSLLIGAQLALLDDRDRLDPARAQHFLRAHRVSWGYLPPALLPLLDPTELPDLRALIVGGDTCPAEQVQRWTTSGRRLLNVYGPTETTVTVTLADLQGDWDRPVPIGGPTGGHRLYLLDADLRPVPDGEPGLLHVAGPGLARGYLGRPAATAAAYLPDPFSDSPGDRMYATGDVGVRRADGLYFLGRSDRQVKVSGQRIELGEIETAVAAHPDVTSAVVEMLTAANRRPELVAFLTPEQGPDLAQLRAHLADRLPAAMMPTRVLHLPRLPMVGSAKVDLAALRARALAMPDVVGQAADHDAADDLDREIAAAWTAALGSPPSGTGDDFLRAGGHSLAAMRLVSRLRTTLGRDISVGDIFTARSPGALRALLLTAPQLQPESPSTGHAAALGSAQRRLWFLDRLTGGTSAYNIALAQRLRGPLDVDALRRALRDTQTRHEVLRWRMPEIDGHPFAEVAAPGPVDLPVDDVGLTHDESPERGIEAWLHEQAAAGFDLAAGPLWRAGLLRVGAEDHVLAVTVHHAIFDGWSVDPLYETLSAAYQENLSGAGPKPLASTPDGDTRPVGYADYVAWSRRRQDMARRPMTQWWVERLAGVPAVVDLARDRSRPAVQTFRGSSVRAVLPAEVTTRVAELSQLLGVTTHTVLLTAFGILVSRLCGQPDLMIGIPAADRRHPDFDQLVGFFVDTLPIPLQVDDERSFTDLVRDVAATVVAALAHRDAPYEDIVDGLRLPRDLSRNPLVQVLFNAFDVHRPRLQLPGIETEPLDPGLPGSLFDLTLYVDSSAADLRLQAVFNPDLYDEARVEALLDSYLCLVSGFVNQPEGAIGRVGARPAGSRLPDPLAALAPAPRPHGVVEAILEVARAEPDRIAVRGPDAELTYAGLAAAAMALAASLGPAGAPVGILAQRGTLLPAQLLGVLASGRPWLILDAGLPGGWLAQLCSAAGPDVLVTEPGQPVPEQLSGLARIDIESASLIPGTGIPTAAYAVLSDRGYLMATSGTTGTPAIVATREAPLAAFLDWYRKSFDLGAGDSTAVLSGLGHDPMLRDVFAALRVGGRVCIPDASLMLDPDALITLLRDESVTVLHLTPQLLRLLSAAPTAIPSVRLLAMAGDRLLGSDATLAQELCPNAVLLNGYGSTETPQIQSWYRIDGPADAADRSGMPIPVGHGRPGVEVHLATPRGQPAAAGELGRVLLRSRHLATGYLTEVPGRDGFGANRFSVNESGVENGDNCAEDRMFATGDTGRYTASGDVVLDGRTDDQVKVRGRRVGLDEVRAAMVEHDSVRDAVVVARGEGDETALIGYVVLHGRQSTEPVRTHLEQRLPDYARPTNLVALPALPLTANGKVDRAALPPARPPARVVSADSEPRTPTEQAIARVWREVLGIASVGVRDNFFDRGGHSLAIVAVQARLSAALRQEIKVVDLFRFPNIAGLAAYLDGAGQAPGLDRASRRLASRRARRTPTTPARSVQPPPLIAPEPEDRR